ncbi:flavodoxin family protein [Rugamonas sp. CCM 8940]|uniref:flavodoxin family protein n=1 Tax=Rugamonas sp. CCM 8940 TaxID=2765359 RepID=UPI0018F4F41F|nr:flavodoxin [Rugamonas sp. CCM 8940]MBJ7312198.1 flavodoxin [Rugamonas sp. CCM 8940]
MKHCLVVYYSRSGLTARAANAIADSCHADLEQIHYAAGPDYQPGNLRALWQALSGAQPALLAPRRDPRDYAVTILGSPVWAYHMAGPMRSYIAARRGRFRRVAAFCTMAGDGGADVLAAMAALAGQNLVASLALRDEQLGRDDYLAPTYTFGRVVSQMVDQLSDVPV